MSLAHPALRRLSTPRLLLQSPRVELSAALLDFHQRNRAHLAPWDPPTPPSFFSLAAQTERQLQGQLAFDAGTAFRWWLSPADEPARLIGSVHISQVSRGAFQSAALGYALDVALQGQGLMHEALGAALAEAFSPRINLHRLQAAYRPENRRSAAVLARLGFEPEGLARDYLYIDGAWRDHQLCARRNPAFHPPGDWSPRSA